MANEKMNSTEEIMNRCRKLGLECETFPIDEMSSALAALACYPMYMVANVDAWTNDVEFRIPILDWPGFEKIRESFVLGAKEAKFKLEKDHGLVLQTLLQKAKPSDLVIYEFALETLQLVLQTVTTSLAEQIRAAIAQTIVAVAKASGEGIGGSGPKITPQEQFCIDDIGEALELSASQQAAATLGDLATEPMSFRSTEG